MTTIASILRHKGHEVASVPPGMTVAAAAQVLAEKRIGAVLVRDLDGGILGILSERDIVRSIPVRGAATLDLSVSDLMTRVLHTIAPHMTVGEAMERMTASRVRHLPVLEEDRLVGLVSIGDVVKARISEQETEVDSLKAYVAGAV